MAPNSVGEAVDVVGRGDRKGKRGLFTLWRFEDADETVKPPTTYRQRLEGVGIVEM